MIKMIEIHLNQIPWKIKKTKQNKTKQNLNTGEVKRNRINT